MSIKNQTVLFNADFVKSVLADDINAEDTNIIRSASPIKDANGYYRMVSGIRVGLGTEMVKPSWITNMPNRHGARFHCLTRGNIATFGMSPSTKEKGINTVQQHSASLAFRTGIECPKSVPSKGDRDWKAWIAVVQILFPSGIPVDIVNNPNDPSELNVLFSGRNQLDIISQKDDLVLEGLSVEEKMKAIYGYELDAVDEEAAEMEKAFTLAGDADLTS